MSKTYTCAITEQELPVGTNAKLISSKPIDSTLMLTVRSKFDNLEDGVKYLNELDTSRTFKYVPASGDYSEAIFVEFAIWLKVSHSALLETYDRL